MRRFGLLATCALVGCFSPDQVLMDPGDPTGSTTSSADTSSSGPDTTSSGPATSQDGDDEDTGLSTTGSTSSEGSEAGDTASSTSTGDPDPMCELENGITVLYECSTFAQDCPSGEKCVPYASSDLGGWNATRCVPVPEDPVPVGATCSAPKGMNAGNDDCGRGLVCTRVQEPFFTGVCSRLCGCAANGEAPSCGPSDVCVEETSPNAPLCFAECSPLAGTEPHCNAGERCVPTDAGPFACRPSVGIAGYGEACSQSLNCQANMFCAPSAAVPGCDPLAQRCCTPYCDLTEAGASQECPGFDAGQTCVPFFTQDPPEGYQDVGFCSL